MEFSDANKAMGMTAYMKNRFRFYGVVSPVRKEIQKSFFPELKKLEINEKWQLIEALYQEPNREVHYFAIDFLNAQPKHFLRAEDLNRLRLLLETNSWWDSVDAIASNYLGKYFAMFPEKIEIAIEKWKEVEDFWLHRSLIIFQLKYGENTNLDLLYQLINEFKSNKEFFIQKAIGWALRTVSQYNSTFVLDTVDSLELHGLARREALRKLTA